MTSNRENDIAALEKPAHEYLKAAAKEYEGDPLGGGRDPAYFWRGLGEYRTLLRAVAMMLLPLHDRIKKLER